jgi:Plant transposon protein
MQESARKDVERCFGVLQARFAIVKGASRFWSDDDMATIMRTCVILHNMIIEDERDDTGLDNDYDRSSGSSVELSNDTSPDFDAFLRRYRAIHNSAKHYQLRNDLIEHLWQRRSDDDE